MYLAINNIRGRRKFFIRDSRFDSDRNCWLSRNLFDLGTNPAQYIEYPGGNSFYLDEELCDQLNDQIPDLDLCELEELFWPFIKKDIRDKLEPFQCRSRSKIRQRKKKAQKDLSDENIHVFDKRRILYLRYGLTDQRRIARLPRKYYVELLGKSRDEIEQYFLQLENSLQPQEYKEYVYVIFDLSRYFTESFARSVPGGLSQNKLDEYFVKEICRLDDDQQFWACFPAGKRLHEYLKRYVIMFFDYDFQMGDAWNQYIRDFINSRRFHQPAAAKPPMEMDEIVEIFGEPLEELQKMNRRALTKLFRERAHDLHPDKGGEHEEFVRLTEAYEELLKGMK
jgi:hypothetical protein